MMKRILFLALLVSTIVSCEQKKHGAFVVTGQIKNAPGKKLLLMETPYANGQPVVLDSTIIKENIPFTLRGRANEEGIYRLVIENGPDVILINDNNSIHLKLDVNDYRNYVVEGSPASESLHQLFEDYRGKDSVILTNFRQIDSVQKVPEQDSLVVMMKTKNDTQIEDLKAFLKNYIDNSKSPAAAFYALGMASQIIEPEQLKAMVDATAGKFPEHAGLARVKSMLAVKKPAAPSAPSASAEGGDGGYALMNKQAPDLTMPDLNGKPISISSFKGKYVLVDFWASWCGPCREENPNVVTAYNQFKGKNFTVLGVSLDKDKAAWKKAVANDNLTWPQMSDLKHWESTAVPTYGFDGIPFNVLIDPDGKIIASALRGQDLINKLAEVLK